MLCSNGVRTIETWHAVCSGDGVLLDPRRPVVFLSAAFGLLGTTLLVDKDSDDVEATSPSPTDASARVEGRSEAA